MSKIVEISVDSKPPTHNTLPHVLHPRETGQGRGGRRGSGNRKSRDRRRRSEPAVISIRVQGTSQAQQQGREREGNGKRNSEEAKQGGFMQKLFSRLKHKKQQLILSARVMALWTLK